LDRGMEDIVADDLAVTGEEQPCSKRVAFPTAGPFRERDLRPR
jgi:hypothetical protein